MATNLITFKLELTTFQNILNNLSKRYSNKVEMLTARYARILFERLVRDTPVDSGFAKSKWSMTKKSSSIYQMKNYTKYLRILEEGLYSGVGKKTIKISSSLRIGKITIQGGIFSTQARHGWIRKNTAITREEYLAEIKRINRIR